jgi:hypothetical protein
VGGDCGRRGRDGTSDPEAIFTVVSWTRQDMNMVVSRGVALPEVSLSTRAWLGDAREPGDPCMGALGTPSPDGY